MNNEQGGIVETKTRLSALLIAYSLTLSTSDTICLSVRFFDQLIVDHVVYNISLSCAARFIILFTSLFIGYVTHLTSDCYSFLCAVALNYKLILDQKNRGEKMTGTMMLVSCR